MGVCVEARLAIEIYLPALEQQGVYVIECFEDWVPSLGALAQDSQSIV